MILELILKICHLKLIYEKESRFSNDCYNQQNYLNLVCSKCNKVYDNFIFMRDFNVAMSDKAMEDFCSIEEQSGKFD